MCTPIKDTIEQDADDSILSRIGTLSGGKTFSNDIDIENLNVSICLALAYKLYSRAIKHPTNYINRLRRPTDYDTQPISIYTQNDCCRYQSKAFPSMDHMHETNGLLTNAYIDITEHRLCERVRKSR